MTDVFFYHGAPDKLAAACKLLGGAAVQKKRVLVYSPDEDTRSRLDRLLWTHNALSFHPHCSSDSPLASETPILLGSSLDTPPAGITRLMNLDQEIPPGYARFQSLIEVVGTEDSDREAARHRVHAYRQAGCTVHYFDLNQPERE